MSFRTSVPKILTLAAGAVAIAGPVVLAPTALATPSGPTCTAVGANSTLCQSDGNAQISATPPAINYQAQYPFFGAYGLIFHHSGGRHG